MQYIMLCRLQYVHEKRDSTFIVAAQPDHFVPPQTCDALRLEDDMFINHNINSLYGFF